MSSKMELDSFPTFNLTTAVCVLAFATSRSLSEVSEGTHTSGVKNSNSAIKNANTEKEIQGFWNFVLFLRGIHSRLTADYDDIVPLF